jgi:DNA-binding XRE family transcriptional regulator
MSSNVVSEPGVHAFHVGKYNAVMAADIVRIGKRHPTRLYIREWIAAEAPHITQKTLAERMGCEPGTVSKLLNGKMDMTLEWLASFADALDKSVPDLFRDPKAPTRDELLAAGTPEELRQAIDLLKIVKTGTHS